MFLFVGSWKRKHQKVSDYSKSDEEADEQHEAEDNDEEGNEDKNEEENEKNKKEATFNSPIEAHDYSVYARSYKVLYYRVYLIIL